MRRLDDSILAPSQRQALAELRHHLLAQFPIETIVLYGSAARGERRDKEKRKNLGGLCVLGGETISQ